MASLLATPYRGGIIIPKARVRIGGCQLNLTVSQCIGSSVLQNPYVHLGLFVDNGCCLQDRTTGGQKQIFLTITPVCRPPSNKKNG